MALEALFWELAGEPSGQKSRPICLWSPLSCRGVGEVAEPLGERIANVKRPKGALRHHFHDRRIGKAHPLGHVWEDRATLRPRAALSVALRRHGSCAVLNIAMDTWGRNVKVRLGNRPNRAMVRRKKTMARRLTSTKGCSACWRRGCIVSLAEIHHVTVRRAVD